MDAIRVYLSERYPIDLAHEKTPKKNVFNLKNLGAVALACGIVVGSWYGYSRQLYLQGVVALEAKQLQKSRSQFQKALRVNPWQSGPHYYLGLICHQQNELQCAAHHYSQEISKRSNPAAPMYQLALVRESEGQYDEATRLLQKARTYSPSNPEILNQLGRQNIQLGNYAKAQAYFKDALKYAESDDMQEIILSQMARILVKEKKWKEAEHLLEQAIALGGSAESLCLLPQVKQRLSDSKEIILGLWYQCFYSSATYPEGDEVKDFLIKRALPEFFTEE